MRRENSYQADGTPDQNCSLPLQAFHHRTISGVSDTETKRPSPAKNVRHEADEEYKSLTCAIMWCRLSDCRCIARPSEAMASDRQTTGSSGQ